MEVAILFMCGILCMIYANQQENAFLHAIFSILGCIFYIMEFYYFFK